MCSDLEPFSLLWRLTAQCSAVLYNVSDLFYHAKGCMQMCLVFPGFAVASSISFVMYQCCLRDFTLPWMQCNAHPLSLSFTDVSYEYSAQYLHPLKAFHVLVLDYLCFEHPHIEGWTQRRVVRLAHCYGIQYVFPFLLCIYRMLLVLTICRVLDDTMESLEFPHRHRPL